MMNLQRRFRRVQKGKPNDYCVSNVKENIFSRERIDQKCQILLTLQQDGITLLNYQPEDNVPFFKGNLA
jgi:hypothetical protein